MTPYYGSKHPDIETFNQSLSHELGNERVSEQTSGRMREASSAKQANEQAASKQMNECERPVLPDANTLHL